MSARSAAVITGRDEHTWQVPWPRQTVRIDRRSDERRSPEMRTSLAGRLRGVTDRPGPQVASLQSSVGLTGGWTPALFRVMYRR